jgi:putative transposase
MGYPYPPHHPDLPYTGRHHYFLTFRTYHSTSAFHDGDVVQLVHAQFLRAAAEEGFAVIAYCFMPDHVHLLVKGDMDRSDCKLFIKAAKQYSGYYFTRRWGRPLWQRYGFERVIRDDTERAFVIGYIVANPVTAGLVAHPSEYPYLGSHVYRLDELLEMCEYGRARM